MSLTDLSKHKILETLPAHFVDEHTDALIRRLEELKGNNWCLYIYDESYVSRGDGILDSLEYTTKDCIKDYLIKYVRNHTGKDYDDTIKDYCRVFKKSGLLPPGKYTKATLESLTALNIEDCKDYLIEFGCTEFVISCHTKYLKDLFSKILH